MAIIAEYHTHNGALVRIDDELATQDYRLTQQRLGSVAERIRRECIDAFIAADTAEEQERLLLQMTRHIKESAEQLEVQQCYRDIAAERGGALVEAVDASSLRSEGEWKP